MGHPAITEAKGQGGHPFQPQFYKTPDRFADQLWEFLKSKRYRDNPRNLAAAMAGLPELSWKRSFDKCSPQAVPEVGMQVRAYREYVRRKFPDRFAALLKAQSTEEIEAILKGSRSRDRILNHLRDNPSKVQNWLEAGKPGNKDMVIAH